MSGWWIVERVDNDRFPWRISIEQDGQITVALRTQHPWPGPGKQVFCLRDEGLAPEETAEPHERIPLASVQRLGRRLSVVLDRPQRKRCDFLFIDKSRGHGRASRCFRILPG